METDVEKEEKKKEKKEKKVVCQDLVDGDRVFYISSLINGVVYHHHYQMPY